MKAILIIIMLGICSTNNSTIYSRQFTTLDGTNIALAQYQGKKMLLVNIASASEFAAVQLPQLEQLYEQYKDSLVVIGFPSNDFGHEPMTDSTILMMLQNTYHTSFPVSVSTSIIDTTQGIHPVYEWLQNQSENGNIDIKVSSDFQKYLIDKDGNIIGVFNSGTSPLDSTLINAITQ